MRPVFIGGCERSGTTMLGALIGGHSHCVCVPESQFIEQLLVEEDFNPDALEPGKTLAQITANERYRLLWPPALNTSTADIHELGTTYPQVLSWLVRAYARHQGKPAAPVWIDHTPTNFKRDRTMLRMFPDARFIHLIRDGRAVTASLLPLDWGPNDVLQAAQFWMARCAEGLAAELELGPERVMRVRYEDVVSQPEVTLRRIAEFAGLDYEEAMATGLGHRPTRYHERQHRLVGRPPDATRVHGWQQVLTKRQVEIFEAEAGEFLETLGYPPEYGIRARPASRLEVFGMKVNDLARRARNNVRRRWRARASLKERRSATNQPT